MFVSSPSTERSHWIKQDGSIRPLYYRYKENGGKDKNVDIRFDWQKRIAVDKNSGRRWQLRPRTQDMASVQFSIMTALGRGEREFSFPILEGDKYKDHRYAVRGERIFATPLGDMKAVEVRELRGEGKRYSSFWCAPALGYLPIRIEQHNASPELTMVLTGAEGQSRLKK